MTTVLERTIESLSDPEVSTADALRRLLVVSRRIGSEPLADWINAELNGFEWDDPAPAHRDGRMLPISVRFDGYAGTTVTRSIASSDLPEELATATRDLYFRQPVAELEALAEPSDDGDGPEMNLPLGWLVRYRDLASQGRVPHMEMMTANRAFIAIPRTRLRGMVDRIRSTALDLALGVEVTATSAGDAGGPTVTSSPDLAQAVGVHLTQIFATNSNVTVASGAGAQAAQVAAGDVEALLSAARLLLDADGTRTLSAALDADGGQAGDQTRNFLTRLRAGAIGLAGGVTTNAAYDGVVQLVKACFPGFG